MSRALLPPSVVGFVGARSLPSSAAAGGLVWRVVASALAAGRRLAVGCAVGADSAVVSAALGQGAAAALRVFCAFGPELPVAPALPPWQGSWRFSGVPAVRAACRAGAAISWFAGASAGERRAAGSLPARLARRSRALVASVVAGGPGSGLVAFVAAPPPRPVQVGPAWSACGSGSWSSVALAVAGGVPVVVFPVGWPLAPLPVLGAGAWVPAGAGVWARGWRWVPAVALRAA